MATTTLEDNVAAAYDRFADHLAAVDCRPLIVEAVRVYADSIRPTTARKDAKLATRVCEAGIKYHKVSRP